MSEVRGYVKGVLKIKPLLSLFMQGFSKQIKKEGANLGKNLRRNKFLANPIYSHICFMVNDNH